MSGRKVSQAKAITRMLSGTPIATDTSVTAPPTGFPPDVHGLTLTLQRKNVTVPVGVGPLPVTVTVSVLELPSGIVGLAGEVVVVEPSLVTVKHSLALAS